MICNVLEGKTAIVTGGAQGLGAYLSLRMAMEGANVVVADLQIEVAEACAKDIREKTGKEAIAIQVDVANEEMVAAMVDKTVETFGSLDAMVANAGILIAGPTLEFDVNRWRKVIEVDLVGYFICAKHAIRVMMPQKSGSIVQINSKSGKVGSYKNSAYAAAKFGGVGLTQSLALEVAEEG